MNSKDKELYDELRTKLVKYDNEVRALPGIDAAARKDSLLCQFVESIHRVNYPVVIRSRDVSPKRADPADPLFDPLKAAIFHQREGNLEEAFWLVFVFVHFGKHARGEWRYAREVYGRLGVKPYWDWTTVSAAPKAFRQWLNDHQEQIKRPGVPGGFGNHRKYESLDGKKKTGTGNAVETYVNWIDPPRTHEALFKEQSNLAGGDPRKTFSNLYKSMADVARFGRTAKFDYLTMIGKLGLAHIEPGSTYMVGSTGPAVGAKLLFFDNTTENVSSRTLDYWLIELEENLGVGMQVMEDALCNWQKSPNTFKAFRG